MARIRTIKPEFWRHEELSTISEPALLLAIALLNYSDDEGFFNANPKLIIAECFPLRELSVNIHVALSELSKFNYIELFQGKDGREYGRVTNFSKHQKVSHPTPSKIAPLYVSHGSLTEASRNTPEPLRPEWKGKEMDMEGKGNKNSINANKQPITAQTPSQLKEYWKPEIQIIIDYFNEKKRSIGMSSNITINDGSCNIIAERLNELSGQPFTAISPEETQKCLGAAKEYIGKDITVPILQCFYVILGRIEKWSDDEKMKSNLSISTIFKAEKFQHYLDEYISTMDLTS